VIKKNLSYDWSFKDYPEKNGFTVMSTFACGGGSSMGYKLAGFDVVAANDIDPDMAALYKKNHKPKQFFMCSVKDLIERDDLPEVDILDGSPPCSVFSTTGLRDKAWGVKKKFREGQSEQILDELFFDFIKLAKKIRPKVIVAENVKGMLIGKAKGYTKMVFNELEALEDYTVQVFLLNSATMGVPQKRERVFFIANRLNKRIKLDFKEPVVNFEELVDHSDKSEKLTPLYHKYWANTIPGNSIGSYNVEKKIALNRPSPTVVSSTHNYHPIYKRPLNEKELTRIGSFPSDYDYNGEKANYVVGMSVPPLMMARIANEIERQILNGL
jgi:DNA (cytosine-5)-methyltransferase 1